MADAQIITLEGDWDIARRDELESLLAPMYDSPGEVIIDMRGVTYADSTILASLIVARNRRRARNLPLPKLVITSNRILRVFTISGLDQAFSITQTVEEALQQ